MFIDSSLERLYKLVSCVSKKKRVLTAYSATLYLGLLKTWKCWKPGHACMKTFNNQHVLPRAQILGKRTQAAAAGDLSGAQRHL